MFDEVMLSPSVFSMYFNFILQFKKYIIKIVILPNFDHCRISSVIKCINLCTKCTYVLQLCIIIWISVKITMWSFYASILYTQSCIISSTWKDSFKCIDLVILIIKWISTQWVKITHQKKWAEHHRFYDQSKYEKLYPWVYYKKL